LGQGHSEGTPNLISPRGDEQKISCIVKALDSVIDRCEDTVRCTSHNLRCWLLSSRLKSRREIAFNLVAEKSSEIKYRRTQKQLLAFVLRMYRMAEHRRREVMDVKIKADISTQLDRIWEHSVWNHIDISKGTWPIREDQGSAFSERYHDGRSSDIIPQQAPVSSQRADRGEDAEDEDEEIDDNGNVEAWELEDEEDEDEEDGEDAVSDYDDDSGYYGDAGENRAGTPHNLSPGVSGDSTTSTSREFLEDLFHLCILLSTEPFLDGQPSSTLLIYFSGILGFSTDGQRFQLARQYCTKLSAMIYIQRMLLLERALPLREYSSIGIPQRQEAKAFDSLDEVRTKYMILGSQHPLAELISLRDFGRNAARNEPPTTLFHWSNDGETISHTAIQVTMDNFRRLPDHFITQAEASCDGLMFGIQPDINL
jgi:hypothetical protein